MILGRTDGLSSRLLWRGFSIAYAQPGRGFDLAEMTGTPNVQHISM